MLKLPNCEPRPWRVGNNLLGGEGTLVMAIINCTPDSFFDGGRYSNQEQLQLRYQECLDAGVDILDLGAESTRPGAPEVSAQDEWARLAPVFEYLDSLNNQIPISIDTTKASVAAQALDAGALIVNDISAMKADPEMAALVSERQASVVLNHMQGTPRTMQSHPQYQDVVLDIRQELGDQVQELIELGLSRDRICVDPGIGFGKDLDHNMDLIWNLSAFDSLACPILMGISRKSFIAKTPGLQDSDRLVPTLSAGVISALAGASILRVHDVKETRESMILLNEMRSRAGEVRT